MLPLRPHCVSHYSIFLSIYYLPTAGISLPSLPPKTHFFSLRVKRMEKVALNKILENFGTAVFFGCSAKRMACIREKNGP